MTAERKLPRCVPVIGWPKKDREAWATALLQPKDALDVAGPASHLRAPSVRLIEQAVGRFLGWLEDIEGRKATNVPHDVPVDALRRYIDWLNERVAPFTVLGHVRDLHEYLRFAWPDFDRSHVKRAERALAWRAKPTKDKRARLRPSEDLVRLGEDLMAEAASAGSGDRRLPLVQYRDGLAIALLALRPLRIRAFASIQLQDHLLHVGNVWKIAIPPELSKNNRPWEADIPSELAPALRHYLEAVRPQLRSLRGRWHSEPGGALWISIDGSAMKPKALGEAITKRTRQAFGQSISPHYFRDCAATTLAYDSPKNVRLATPLLGHTSPKTTEKHYNQARQIEAGRKLNTTLSELRRRLR
ncbi:tyrosine-type recombinase/integrase [Shimia abyssi]|uniref:Site-specific recombinase XerC n=1 Tax=Shimia abyssi TaxID=1662395 RepID=A0A2P8ET23_9RHOB|nr:tyrosine-type recombinase/integrase [Shimia abyssi]PSL12637.1 site-specific recombinase XerC [Shimia abyssi]